MGDVCMKVTKFFAFILAAFVWVLFIVQPAYAAEGDNAEGIESVGALELATMENAPLAQENLPEAAQGEEQMSLLSLINKGGPVGYLIILLSVISLALIIDYAFTIRKSKMIPPKDIKSLKALIKEGKLEDLSKYEKTKASFLSRVAAAGLRESHLGYHTMVKAMEDTVDDLSGSIARKTEHLNVIGNISPMMGLLGTVIGMLRCFNEIAHVAGAIDPKQLAGGIFEALVTTCMGLIVAIPSLYCYSIFRNRVEDYTAKASLVAEKLVLSFKPDPDEK